MRKIFLVIMIIAVAGMVFAGGSRSSGTAAAVQPKQSDIKVASHNAVIEGNPYRVVYEDQMYAAANRMRAQGIVGQYATFTSNNDPAVETQQIQQTVDGGYDVIIVNPIAVSGLDPVINRALNAGIVYVNADCEYDSPRILNVVVDQRQWAKIQSDFVIRTLGAGKRVIQFNGIDGNSASEMRNEVWQTELRGAGLQIVRTMAHNWQDTDAKRLMSEVISSGLQFDGIINQESALGIMGAIEESNIPFPGCITSSEEVAWIRKIASINSTRLALPFIVVENPPGIGATALAIGINLKQGRELKDGIASAGLSGNSIYYTPQWVMTYDNMASRLDEIKDMPDSTSVSSYMTLEQARTAYFK